MPPPTNALPAAAQQMGKHATTATTGASAIIHKKIWIPLAKRILDRCSPTERTELTANGNTTNVPEVSSDATASIPRAVFMQHQQEHTKLKQENETLLDRLREETRAHSQERSKLWEKIEQANSAAARATHTMKMSAVANRPTATTTAGKDGCSLAYLYINT
jgi:hypothetical protein